MLDFKGSQFEREIILWGVRWYVAYPISYRQLEEMMGERGVAVDHSTLNRWVIKYVPEVSRCHSNLEQSVPSRLPLPKLRGRRSPAGMSI